MNVVSFTLRVVQLSVGDVVHDLSDAQKTYSSFSIGFCKIKSCICKEKKKVNKTYTSAPAEIHRLLSISVN